MDQIFWLRKDKVAGRSGPNTVMWDLAELKAGGIAAILSVNNGEAVDESLLSDQGLAYSNIPMSSNAPARAGDKEYCLENIPKAMSFIRDSLLTGPVLIHCRSGKDRTGMVMAAYLMESESCSAKEAMDQVIDVRPIAFSAEGWMEFGLDVLSGYQLQND